jgi:hypothetical protein
MQQLAVFNFRCGAVRVVEMMIASTVPTFIPTVEVTIRSDCLSKFGVLTPNALNGVRLQCPRLALIALPPFLSHQFFLK